MCLKNKSYMAKRETQKRKKQPIESENAVESGKKHVTECFTTFRVDNQWVHG